MGELNQMLSKARLFFLLLFSLQFQPILGQKYEIGGYIKYLFSSTSISGIDKNLIDHTLHSRVNFKYYLNDDITYSLGLRDLIIYGKSPETIPDYEQNFGNKTSLLKWEGFLWKKKKSINYFECDRMWLDFHLHDLQISVGKQRIAWGTSLVWNITDLFNPLSILDFDYEERSAVDAVRIQYYTSELSKFDLAFKPAKEKKNSTVAVQYTGNVHEYDFSILSGFHKNRFLAGTNWAGDIHGAGFRGELLLMQSPASSNIDTLNLFAKENRLQFSAVLSVDYTFSNSLYIHSEILFNDIGKTEQIGLYIYSASEIGLLSPSKLELFYHIGYDVTPLLRGDIMMLQNPYDGSCALLPMFSYSLKENLDLSLIALCLYGKDLSEYGPERQMGFVRLKYSF